LPHICSHTAVHLSSYCILPHIAADAGRDALTELAERCVLSLYPKLAVPNLLLHYTVPNLPAMANYGADARGSMRVCVYVLHCKVAWSVCMC
jgi:hypothetical protein